MSISSLPTVEILKEELIKQYKQETESNYVATLLISLIEAKSSILDLISVDKPYFTGQPDIYCEYKNIDGCLLFEIKSQRAHDGLHMERRRICGQLKKYMNFRKTADATPKAISDTIATFHSADIEFCLNEFNQEDVSFESYLKKNLCFLAWDIVDMFPENQLRIRYFKGRNSIDDFLDEIKSMFNGYNNNLSNIIIQMQTKKIRLVPQNDQCIMVMIIEKAWDLYDPSMRFSKKIPNPRSPQDDFFLEDNTIFFSLPCMDWFLNEKQTNNQKYCANIPRSRIQKICNFMSDLGLLSTMIKDDSKYYGHSLYRREKKYDETVCQTIAEYNHNEMLNNLGQKKIDDYPVE